MKVGGPVRGGFFACPAHNQKIGCWRAVNQPAERPKQANQNGHTEAAMFTHPGSIVRGRPALATSAGPNNPPGSCSVASPRSVQDIVGRR